MRTPSTLEAAYREARYRLTTAGETIELRVGTHSPALDRRLAAAGARRWAWLTAVNPGSRRLPRAANEARLADLDVELAGRGLVALAGVAVDPAGGWPDEESRLVLDCAPALARALADRHGQLAFLAGEAGGEVRLEWTRSAPR
jgi:hypothetical protein